MFQKSLVPLRVSFVGVSGAAKRFGEAPRKGPKTSLKRHLFFAESGVRNPEIFRLGSFLSDKIYGLVFVDVGPLPEPKKYDGKSEACPLWAKPWVFDCLSGLEQFAARTRVSGHSGLPQEEKNKECGGARNAARSLSHLNGTTESPRYFFPTSIHFTTTSIFDTFLKRLLIALNDL